MLGPKKTNWASPFVFATKRYRALRFRAYCRIFNAVAIRDSYALQRMDRRVESLEDAQLLSTIDVDCGYCNIEADPSEI